MQEAGKKVKSWDKELSYHCKQWTFLKTENNEI